METQNQITKELQELDCSFTQVPHPYQVPKGYFDGLAEEILFRIKAESFSSDAAEELAQLSPTLAALKKEMPYSLPEGFFEKQDLQKITGSKTKKDEAKVVSIQKATQWWKYAAAAVVTGLVVLSIVFINSNSGIDPNEKSYAWVEKNLKKVNTESIQKFVQLTEAGQNGNNGITVSPEVNALMQALSDQEVEEFLAITTSMDYDIELNEMLN